MQHVRALMICAAEAVVEQLHQVGVTEGRRRAAELCERRALSAELSGHPAFAVIARQLLAVATEIRQGASR